MERVLRVGALNVVTHPHSPANYQRLFEKVKGRKAARRIRGDRFGIIGQMSTSDSPKKTGAYLQGILTTFTQIDVDGDWVNVSTGRKAEDSERMEIRIPAHLRPNPSYNRFRFYLNEHILVFEIGNSSHRLTPVNAERLFEKLFSHAQIVRDFGEVEVTAWPDRNALNAILLSAGLRAMHLVIHAPNPDDAKQAHIRYMKRLENMGARRLEESFIAKKDNVIKPDKELREAAQVAATNGSVDALVQVGKRVKRLSTKDTPFIYTHEWYEEGNIEEREFGIACEVVRRQLRNESDE